MTETNKNAIGALLREKTQSTVKAFAKKHNVTRKVVYECFHGGGSQRIRIEIAKSIGKAPSKIWGEDDLRRAIIDDLLFAKSIG